MSDRRLKTSNPSLSAKRAKKGRSSSHARTPAVRERSAGVLAYRLASSGNREFLLLNHGRHWDLPKGHLEPGETDRIAALRELAEETGITDCILDPVFCREVTYFFRRGAAVVRKEVIFFLGQTAAPHITLSDEHVDAAFLEPAAALQRLTYPTAREILRTALHHLMPATPI